MKKICLVFLVLTLLSSCVGNEESSKKSYYSSNKKFKKNSNKFSRRVKPSEAMQPGEIEESKNIFSKSSKNEYRQDSEEYSGYFKVGEPYQIYGVSYIPQDYEEYEETGMASWYGDKFNGKETANGEIYNIESITAAHRTLPLPSMVRITNLKNNKTLVVRVNDRGPFAKERVIDVSQKAADLLGFKDQGTTMVKVQLLRNDTDRLLEDLKLKN